MHRPRGRKRRAFALQMQVDEELAIRPVTNLVTANVIERSAEIGLMKAVGAQDLSIIALFLAQIILVGLAGGGIGYAGGLVLARLIGQIVFSSPIEVAPVVAI